MAKTTSKTRKPQKPAWFVARASIVLAALFFAAFAVYYWAAPLWNANPVLSVFIGAGFALSALVTPSVAPKLVHSKGATTALLFAVCCVFGAIDSLGVGVAFGSLEQDMTQAEYDDAMSDYKVELSTLTNAVTAAQAKLDAVPLPDAKGAIRKDSTWTSVNGVLEGRVNSARGRLDALAKPSRKDLFPNDLVMLLSFMLQAAIAVGAIALEAARSRIYSDACAAYEARLETLRKERVKVERKKQRKAKAAPFTPRLVAAND